MKIRLVGFGALAALIASIGSAQSSSLVNTSTRGLAGSGASTMISGFVVSAPPNQLRWVLVRGVGPGLAAFGVASPLADPAIRLIAANGTVVAVNDNLGTAPNAALLGTVTSAVGAFPLSQPAEAAVLVGLPAGAYTVQLGTNAANATASPALLEVYEAGAVASGQTSQTISGLAAANPNLTTLTTALRITGLDATLATGGPYTVFAPTDAAFAALPAGTLDNLVANPTQLAQILLFHVVNGQVLSNQLSNGQQVATLRTGARPLAVTIQGGSVRIDAATVAAADVRALNGVVHVIDRVLTP